MDLIVFLLSFAVILIGCEFFTNGVEWIGKRFNLAEGAVGSLLAAVGTALPETILPLIAILFIGGEAGNEIGTGAILGSPFMLATMALFICGLSVFVFARGRKTKTLHINGSLIRRDLKFFLLAYTIAAITALLPQTGILKYLAAVSLLLIYIGYSYYTLKTGESQGESDLHDLYLTAAIAKVTPVRFRKDPSASEPHTLLIILQVLVSLAFIIVGASMFVNQIKDIASILGVNPLILSLIICPIATELPEMFNSMMWIRNRKDTFAIGNITGAMVFQSCIPVTIGVLLTGWHLDLADNIQFLEAISIGFALFSALVLYWRSSQKEIKISGLVFGGLLYLLFFVIVLLYI